MRLRDALAFAAAAVTCFSAASQAQTYPNKTITFVVGSETGGSGDLIARMYADIVSRSLGQRIVVENRPGASSIVAGTYVQGQPADGYTILQIGNGLPEAMPAMQSMPFDPIKDFTYISGLATTDNYVWVRSDLPPKTASEFVAFAKTKPGGVSIGVTGPGSPATLAVQIFKTMANAPIDTVNYKGNAQAVSDLMAGRLESVANGYSTSRPAIEAGKTRALVINSDHRSRRFPDVPTYAEAGYPGVAVATWWGLIGPKGMPKEIVDRLTTEFAKAGQDPSLVQRFTDADLEPFVIPGDRLIATAMANQERQGKIIKQLGIRND